MGARREGRVAAFQILYQMDTRESFEQVDEAVGRHFSNFAPDAADEVRELAASLCREIVANRGELDELLDRASDHWRVSRMSRVDRNVLRVAAYELKWTPQVPASVAIHEAVEIGKAFGSDKSSAFINGLLDRLSKD